MDESAHAIGGIQREGGKFRSFLLTALNHFLINEWEHQRAQKRDQRKVAFSLDALKPEARYQVEPADVATPESLFERQWAANLLAHVMSRLCDEYTRDGKAELFQRLRPCLTGAEQMLPYAELAVLLGTTGDAVKMAVHRLRKRYGELLRAALSGSACQIVICSPASAASRWVNEEILSFKRLGRADRIFALIVGGEPYAAGMPGREREECFPPALRYQLGPDGNLSDVPAEPIAAYARTGKDGKLNALPAGGYRCSRWRGRARRSEGTAEGRRSRCLPLPSLRSRWLTGGGGRGRGKRRPRPMGTARGPLWDGSWTRVVLDCEKGTTS